MDERIREIIPHPNRDEPSLGCRSQAGHLAKRPWAGRSLRVAVQGALNDILPVNAGKISRYPA